MKITFEIEQLGELTNLVKTCDKHWKGVVVGVAALVILLGSVSWGVLLLIQWSRSH